jgi:hypothetical protein
MLGDTATPPSSHAVESDVLLNRKIQMVCERPPAAFGGSPPHGGGESNEVVHTYRFPLT